MFKIRLKCAIGWLDLKLINGIDLYIEYKHQSGSKNKKQRGEQT